MPYGILVGFAPPSHAAEKRDCMLIRVRQLLCDEHNNYAPFSSRLMSASEIVRELRRLRYDPANGRGKARKVPLKRIAEQAGVHRMTVYRIIWGGRISDKSRVALSLVLVDRV
jgi:hypothetical protein